LFIGHGKLVIEKFAGLTLARAIVTLRANEIFGQPGPGGSRRRYRLTRPQALRWLAGRPSFPIGGGLF
jgi:hypothetical protein